MKIFNEITSFPPPLPFHHSHYLFHPISTLLSIQNSLNIACQIVRTPICRNRYEPCRCNSCFTCIMNSQLHYTPLYNRIIQIWNHRIFKSQLLLWFTSPAIQFPPHSSGSSRRFEWDLARRQCCWVWTSLAHPQRPYTPALLAGTVYSRHIPLLIAEMKYFKIL